MSIIVPFKLSKLYREILYGILFLALNYIKKNLKVHNT